LIAILNLDFYKSFMNWQVQT